MDIQQIQEVLPHRYPFLLVDRVLRHDPDEIVARKNVTSNEPFFAGHFPGYPVMPGVLLIEAMAQTGALLACKAVDFDPAKQVIFFMGIDKAKFRRQVVPGDVVDLHVAPLRKGGKIWKMKGQAKVEGEVAAEAEFLAMLADRKS